ncbi:MAG TPA: hypothetical protein VL382_03860, partial [Terriglobales bacterium]|nr:hypothetical protein [Terriglobales bacterium]
GGSFRSDGRILVLMLTPSGRDGSSIFADIFCSVLGRENPDGGKWGDCSQYLKTAGKTTELAPLSTKYRVLILPGFLSSCVSSTPALQKGQAHLQAAHGMAVEYLPLPNASSEANAKTIADYIGEHSVSDPRKYILIGYSKGAPDAQVAIENFPQARAHTAAFVSLAGAIGGSPIANTLPAVIDKYAKALNLGSCQGDLAEAAKSLRSDIRHNFLAMHPTPSVPSYSFTAFSDKANTSKMLLQAWQLLSAYDAEQDSQMTRQDAYVPGSTFLGSAKADHLAVALAFEDSSDASVKAMMDKNHYPRAALFESLIRAVILDLDKDQKAAPPATGH